MYRSQASPPGRLFELRPPDELPREQLLVTAHILASDGLRVEGIGGGVASVRLPEDTIATARDRDGGQRLHEQRAYSSATMALVYDQVLKVKRRAGIRPKAVLDERHADDAVASGSALHEDDREIAAVEGVAQDLRGALDLVEPSIRLGELPDKGQHELVLVRLRAAGDDDFASARQGVLRVPS